MKHEQIDLFAASYEEAKLPGHIRLIEFFAGIGAQAKALEILNADFEHWRTCEWSWQSIIAYNAIHIKTTEDYSKPFSYDEILNAIRGVSHDYNQPMTEKQLRAKGEEWARKVYNAMIGNNNFCPDISKLHAKDLDIEDKENNTYILTYSFPCVLPGEKVKTTCGYKKIEEVNEGDMVLTHEGRYKRVSMLMQKMASEYYSIKAVGAANLRLTANHPLYILRDNKLEWVQVADLKKGDYLVYNINQKAEDTELDNATLWLLGRYVADGLINPRHHNSVAFAVGLGKEAEFDFKAPAEYRNRWKIYHKSCDEYRIADKRLKDLCAQFGSGAKNKRIPQWVIDLPKDKLQSFFDGYIAGDGHIRKHGNGTQVMFTTVSENLFLGLEEIVMKLYGIIPSVSIRKDNRKETFNDSYNAQFTLERQLFQKTDGRYAYALVKKTELIEQETPVFNLMVDGDNSYTVQNVIVHNCQDLSLAGQHAGMEKGGSTRSGLLWEVERILNECKELDTLPQVLIMENVPQVCGKGNLKPWGEWLLALEEMGYTNYFKILNSKDYGIPQNRKRCFMVSILGQKSYLFPKKTKLRYVLKDFIEKKVDEYYYLSDKLVQCFVHHTEKHAAKGNGFAFKPTQGEGIAGAVLTREGERCTDNYLEMPTASKESEDLSTPLGKDYSQPTLYIPAATKKGYMEAHEGDGVLPSWKGARGTVQEGGVSTILTSPETIGVVVKDERDQTDAEIEK